MSETSPGMQRQLDIYQSGPAGKKLSVPISLPLLEAKAKEILPPQAYEPHRCRRSQSSR